MTQDVNMEAVLLARVATGDEQALAALYDRLSCLAYGLALCVAGDPEVAEDAVVESFLRLWRRADRHNALPSRVRPWFLRLVRDLTIDRLRADGAARGAVARGADAPHAFACELTEETEARRERAARLRAVLEEMAPDQRRALETAYFEGLTSSEIAKREGAPLSTVRARIRDGVLRLHVQLCGEVANV